MKVTAYYNQVTKNDEFQVISYNHNRTVRAWANVNRYTNETKWYFQYEQNGQRFVTKSWDEGLERLEAKGW